MPAQRSPLPLLRHRRLHLHHLLPPRRSQNRLRRRQSLHAQTLPPARLRARDDGRRHRLLPALPRSLYQAARDARHYNTPIRYGCPYDCGLCPDHEQHCCLTLVEITDACNLTCPICYAESGPHRTDASLAGASRIHARLRGAQREASPTSCRSAAASRRFIRNFSTFSTPRSAGRSST